MAVSLFPAPSGGGSLVPTGANSSPLVQGYAANGTLTYSPVGGVTPGRYLLKTESPELSHLKITFNEKEEAFSSSDSCLIDVKSTIPSLRFEAKRRIDFGRMQPDSIEAFGGMPFASGKSTSLQVDYFYIGEYNGWHYRGYRQSQTAASLGYQLARSFDGFTYEKLPVTTGVDNTWAQAMCMEGDKIYAISGTQATMFTTVTLGQGDEITYQGAETSGIGGSSFRSIAKGPSFFLGVTDGGSIRKSNDGITWTTASAPPISGDGFFLQFFDNWFYLLDANSIRRSTDGVTWVNSFSFGSARYGKITKMPDNSLVLTAYSGAELRRSTDGGATWPSTGVNVSPGNVRAHVFTGPTNLMVESRSTTIHTVALNYSSTTTVNLGGFGNYCPIGAFLGKNGAWVVPAAMLSGSQIIIIMNVISGTTLITNQGEASAANGFVYPKNFLFLRSGTKRMLQYGQAAFFYDDGDGRLRFYPWTQSTASNWYQRRVLIQGNSILVWAGSGNSTGNWYVSYDSGATWTVNNNIFGQGNNWHNDTSWTNTYNNYLNVIQTPNRVIFTNTNSSNVAGVWSWNGQPTGSYIQSAGLSANVPVPIVGYRTRPGFEDFPELLLGWRSGSSLTPLYMNMQSRGNPGGSGTSMSIFYNSATTLSQLQINGSIVAYCPINGDIGTVGAMWAQALNFDVVGGNAQGPISNVPNGIFAPDSLDTADSATAPAIPLRWENDIIFMARQRNGSGEYSGQPYLMYWFNSETGETVRSNNPFAVFNFTQNAGTSYIGFIEHTSLKIYSKTAPAVMSLYRIEAGNI